MSEFKYSIVKDPTIYMQNRLNPHSDHEFYKLLPQLFAADGVSIKIYSGYRPGARTAQGLPSQHDKEH